MSSSYLLTSLAISLTLWLYFFLFLKHEVSLGFNRAFLLLAPCVALILPLLHLQLPWTVEVPSLTLPLTQTFYLQPLENNTNAEGTSFHMGLVSWLWIIYLLVAITLFTQIVIQTVRITQLIRGSVVVKKNGLKVVHTTHALPTFSFFSFLFWDSNLELKDEEKRQIWEHEKGHITLGHSWDVVYYELLCVIWWFNPAIWLSKAALLRVHEFQADRYSVGQGNQGQYAQLLSKVGLRQMGLLPGHAFFRQNELLLRLQMISKYPHKANKWRMALAFLWVLMVPITMLSFIQPVETRQDSQATSAPLTQVDENATPQEGMDKFLEQFNLMIRSESDTNFGEGKVFIEFVVDENGQLGNFQVAKTFSDEAGQFAREALASFTSKQTWKPAQKDGHVVKQKMILPIQFAASKVIEE